MIRAGEYTEHIKAKDSAPLTIQGQGDVTIHAAEVEDVIDVKGTGAITIRNLAIVGGDKAIDIDAGIPSATLVHVTTTGTDSDGVQIGDNDPDAPATSHSTNPTGPPRPAVARR